LRAVTLLQSVVVLYCYIDQKPFLYVAIHRSNGGDGFDTFLIYYRCLKGLQTQPSLMYIYIYSVVLQDEKVV